MVPNKGIKSANKLFLQSQIMNHQEPNIFNHHINNIDQQMEQNKLKTNVLDLQKITRSKRGLKKASEKDIIDENTHQIQQFISVKKTLNKKTSFDRKSMPKTLQTNQQKINFDYTDLLQEDNNIKTTTSPVIKQFLENSLKNKQNNQLQNQKSKNIDIKNDNQNSMQMIMEETTRDTYHDQRSTSQAKDTIVIGTTNTRSEYSKETEDILNSLLSNNNPIQPPPNESLDQKILHIQSGGSMREKYGDLSADQLPLPYLYSRLQKCQELTDNMLVTFSKRGKSRFFSNVSSCLESSCRIHMKAPQLRQILGIEPDLYSLSYERNHERGGSYDLFITLPDHKETSQRLFLINRKQTFRESLLNIVKQQHSLFLQSIGYGDTYDYSFNTWHPQFDLHSISQLKLADLPKKPIQIRDFLSKIKTSDSQQQNIDNQYGQQTIDQIIEEKTNRKTLSERTQEFMKKYSNMQKDAAKGIQVFDSQTGLSIELTNRIKEKEEKMKEEKEKKEIDQLDIHYEFKNKKKELKTLVEMINHIYLKRGVSNMFYVTLIDVCWTTKHSLNVSKDEMTSLIDYLKDNYHDWIKYIPNKNGQIVRINRTISLSTLLKQIDAI